MASVAGAFHITLSGRTCEFDTIKEVLGTIELFFFFFSFLKDPLSRPLRFWPRNTSQQQHESLRFTISIEIICY
jgi:hypothetical protein